MNSKPDPKYQKVNVKPKRVGNNNTNAINIVINPDENGMYKHNQAPRPSTSQIMNTLAQPTEADPRTVGQILGRMERSGEGQQLSKSDVEQGIQAMNVQDMGNSIRDSLSEEEMLEEQEERLNQIEDNIQRLDGRFDGAQAQPISTFTQDEFTRLEDQIKKKRDMQLNEANDRIKELEAETRELQQDLMELDDDAQRILSVQPPISPSPLGFPQSPSLPMTPEQEIQMGGGPLLNTPPSLFVRTPQPRNTGVPLTRPMPSMNSQFAQGTDALEAGLRRPRPRKRS